MKTRSILASLAAAASLFAAVAAHADALDEIKQRGTLMVGVEAGGTGAILSAEPGGKIIGQDADLNALVAQKLGVKLEMIETPWPGIIPALLSKRFDMIMSGMTATKARSERVNFSTPYGDASLVAAALSANGAIKSPDDLAGKTIGVLLGTNTVDFAKGFAARLAAKNLPAPTVKTYDDFPSLFVELSNKNIDVVMLPRPIMGGYMVQKPGAFKVIEGLGDKSYFGVAMRKEDTALLAAVNKILMDAKADGTLAAVQKKWLGAPTGALPDSWLQP
jgi:polar amino acid transport system substrate-binding protein